MEVRPESKILVLGLGSAQSVTTAVLPVLPVICKSEIRTRGLALVAPPRYPELRPASEMYVLMHLDGYDASGLTRRPNYFFGAPLALAPSSA